MTVVMSPVPERPPTFKWIIRWSFIATGLLLGALAAFRADEKPVALVGIMAGFFGLLIVSMVVTHRSGPISRYLPVMVSTVAVGPWPYYRLSVYSDWRFANLYLFLAGGFVVIVTASGLYTLMKERGVLVDSPSRRRLRFALMIALGLNSVAHLDSTLVTVMLLIAFVAVMFWPSRWSVRRAS
jgi:hypothetical protein